MASVTGPFGHRRCDDGKSRQFDPESTDPRVIIASELAQRDGWAEIRLGHWGEAGGIVKALKGKGLLVDRRTLRKPL
jgi:hypothetical protein